MYNRTLRDRIKTSDKGKNYKVGTLSDYTMELLRDYKTDSKVTAFYSRQETTDSSIVEYPTTNSTELAQMQE